MAKDLRGVQMRSRRKPAQVRGRVRGGRVDLGDQTAVEYEFYIPNAIWSHPSVQAFIKRLQSVVGGATVFGSLGGVWQGKPEATRIYRLIIPVDQFDIDNTRASLHSEIARLLTDLSGSPKHAQQTFMFTETDVRVTMARS
jgi:hypothetical protein